jgi:hypothetical protein
VHRSFEPRPASIDPIAGGLTLSRSPPTTSARTSLWHIVFSHRRCLYHGVLTEPTLLNLFRGQGKHRKQFNHYFDDDIRHYRSRRNRCIDLHTPQKTPQALEEVEQRIVTRRNPTSSLACSYVTRELFEGYIRGTYIKKCINPGKQRACWWEGDLMRSR